MHQMARVLIVAGVLLAALGAALWGLSSLPLIGRLPGDIYLRRGNAVFYFPLATCLLISLVLTLLLSLFKR
jgi:hypothetical protein